MIAGLQGHTDINFAGEKELCEYESDGKIKRVRGIKLQGVYMMRV